MTWSKFIWSPSRQKFLSACGEGAGGGVSECRRRRASVFRKLGRADDVGEDRETTHPVHHELPLRGTVHGDENLAQGDRGRLAATLRVGRRGHLRGGVVGSVAKPDGA